MDDFIVPDDEDEDNRPPKKKSKSVPKTPSKAPEPKVSSSSTGKYVYRPKTNDSVATPVKAPARNTITPSKPSNTPSNNKTNTRTRKLDEQRYPWLVNVLDADKNPPDHPDYDPRTLYIPPSAWAKFSPFEKQYWEIKCKNYDTVVFFKKGKFFELFENDATVGQQEFDLKMTERVNMRMVGVPVTSFNTWATQFIAKGYKVARVEQFETALGKEMREKENKGGKEEKVIRRELACILTAGTLVDEVMLQDEMSIYCVAIKVDKRLLLLLTLVTII